MALTLAACGKSVKEGDKLYVAENELTIKSGGAGVKAKPNASTPTVRIVPISAALGTATGKVVEDKNQKFYEFVDHQKNVLYVLADVVNVYPPGSRPPKELRVRFKQYAYKCKEFLTNCDTNVEENFTVDIFYPQFYSTENPAALATINQAAKPTLSNRYDSQDCAHCSRYEYSYNINTFNSHLVSYTILDEPGDGCEIVKTYDHFWRAYMDYKYSKRRCNTKTNDMFLKPYNFDVQTGKKVRLCDVVKIPHKLNQIARELFRAEIFETKFPHADEYRWQEIIDCLNLIACDCNTDFSIRPDTLVLMFNPCDKSYFYDDCSIPRLYRESCFTIEVPVPLEDIRENIRPGALKYFEREDYRVENPYGQTSMRKIYDRAR
ncbi:MAG: hypothetical protein RMM53_00885 [Bacteroidia bacterium]|nr:hypothetical protein [Bacteroidia bacterium]